MKKFDLSSFGKQATQRVTLYGNIIDFAGNQGSLNIDINGHTKVATFDSDLGTTIVNFVKDNYDFYKLHGYTLFASGGSMVVTSAYGWETVNNIVITLTPYVPIEASPTTTAAATTTGGVDLTGILVSMLNVDFAKARIWKVSHNSTVIVNDPVNPADGDKIYVEFTTTVPTTIFWGSKWEFSGVTGDYDQINSLFSAIEGIYDAELDKVICNVTIHSIYPATTPAP